MKTICLKAWFQFLIYLFGLQANLAQFHDQVEKKYVVKDPSLYAKEKEEIKEIIQNKAKVPGLLQSSEFPEVQGKCSTTRLPQY